MNNKIVVHGFVKNFAEFQPKTKPCGMARCGLTFTNDILGNRLGNSVTSNGWDQLNRMTTFVTGGSSPVTWSYAYRADGMRVSKSAAGTTMFAYDGQMGFEDVDDFGSTSPTVKDYAIGGRGIDRIAIGTSVGYPIYDGHGNMVATLAESGSSFSVGNHRAFDAWGNVLSGSSGDPTGRYCANLGHKQDDENGLIYMRARYYEPTSGRFVSEDPRDQGRNYYAYCSNDPVGRIDKDGKADTWDSFMASLAFLFAFTGCAFAYGDDLTAALICAKLAILCFTVMFAGDEFVPNGLTPAENGTIAIGGLFIGGIGMICKNAWLTDYLSAATAALEVGDKSMAANAVNATFVYSLEVCAALLDIDSGN